MGWGGALAPSSMHVRKGPGLHYELLLRSCLTELKGLKR